MKSIEQWINNDCKDCKEEEFCQACYNEAKMKHEVSELLRALIPYIDDDCMDEDGEPILQVTIASNDGDEWSYQTGDNSFTGSCYHYHHWGVGYLTKDTDCDEQAEYMVDQVFEGIAWS